MKKFYTLIAAIVVVSSSSLVAGASTAFGYQMGDKNYKYGFVSFPTDGFGETTILKETYSWDIHISAGEYVDGKLYAYRVIADDYGSDLCPDSYAIYNATTFSASTEIDRMFSPRVVDMTYDYSTNTMYALVEDKYSTGRITTTSLCVIPDLTTGETIRIGSAGDLKALNGYNNLVETKLVTLAADAEGNIYAMSDLRQFYKLDKFTGAATQIGGQHSLATIDQFQSMAFDTDGTLYWAQQTPDYGWFSTIDTSTGVPTKLGTLGADAQITALYFKKEINRQSPLKVENLTASQAEGRYNDINLTWELPTVGYDGNPTTITSVKVYRFGESEPVAVLDGQAVSFCDVDAPNGDLVYEVIPVSGNTVGFPAFASVYSGYDALTTVGNLTASIDGAAVTVTWLAPTTTVNGGYADFENITYNIYRVKGAVSDMVATGVAERRFSETLSEAGTYSYSVEPVSGGVVGQKATSNEVRYETIATIPYFTGFEDDQDGSLWSFIKGSNHTQTKYGWSIYVPDAPLEGKSAVMYTGGYADYGDDWLVSPAIHFTPGDYTVKYYAYGGTYDKHSWEVKLGTDPNDAESFDKQIASYSEVKVDSWDVPYAARFTVESEGDYHLALHSTTTAIYAKLRIDNLSIDQKAGIIGVEADGGHSWYVDPSTDGVRIISSTGIGSYVVADLQGRVVAQNSNVGGGTEAAVDLSLMSKGVYVVKVGFDDGTCAVAKFVLR